jgi:hypothetical protein
MRNGLRYVVLAMSLTTITRAAGAQTSVAFQPVVSYYRPLGYFRATDVLSTALPEQPGELRGVAWGGDVQLRFGGRLGLEASAQTTTHTLPSCTCPEGPTGASPVHVTIAAVTAQSDLSLRPERYHLWAGVGPAVIRHSGRGYEPDSPTSLGGAFGLQLGIPLAAHWQLVAGGTGIGYWFDFAFPAEHGPQMDALLSIGARWHT